MRRRRPAGLSDTRYAIRGATATQQAEGLYAGTEERCRMQGAPIPLAPPVMLVSPPKGWRPGTPLIDTHEAR